MLNMDSRTTDLGNDGFHLHLPVNNEKLLVLSGFYTLTVSIKNLVQTRIPTQYGEFFLHYFSNTQDDKEHVAFVFGQVTDKESIPVRIHSECFTGDVFGSRRCDCGEQLDSALKYISEQGAGVLLYLRQEGRGIGLLKKMQAYNLQDEGMDTVDANLHLGHLADERDYTVAALMLENLKISSIKLITNNPNKIQQMQELGVKVEGRIAIHIASNSDNQDYLKTKVDKMRHLLQPSEY